MLIALQATNLFVDRRPIARFHTGLLIATSCIVVSIVLVLANTRLRQYDPPTSSTIVALEATQAALLTIIFIGCITIQRRPELSFNEKRVDGQYTVSALGRYTYAWAWASLSFAKKNRGLKIENVAVLANKTRARTLLERFHRSHSFSRLWMRMLWFFKAGLLEATVFISVAGVLQFVPQLAMLNVLRLMESRVPGELIAKEAYFWILGMGISMIISAFVETWVFWIVESRLGIPARATLSALVFEKATRRKNVQGNPKKKTKDVALEGSEEPAVIVNEGAGDHNDSVTANQTTPNAGEADTVVTGSANKNSKTKDKDEDEEDEQKKSRQGVINLIAVDTQRFQFFMTYAYIYPNVVVKIFVSMTFLLNIIGWAPLLAGLAAFACTLPFNIFWSRKYTGMTNKLMKLRDEKLAVVTEALQGIRQIKYSAIETQWQDRIMGKRRQELGAQWSAFLLDFGLIGCWISGDQPSKNFDNG